MKYRLMTDYFSEKNLQPIHIAKLLLEGKVA
jgi:hypothetical protein